MKHLMNLFYYFILFFFCTSYTYSQDSIYVLQEIIINKREKTNKSGKLKTINYREKNAKLGFKAFDYKQQYEITYRLSDLPNGIINNVVFYFSNEAFFKLNKLKKPENLVSKSQDYEVLFYRLVNNKRYLVKFDNETKHKFTIAYAKNETTHKIDLSAYYLLNDEDIWIQIKPVSQCTNCLVMLPVAKYLTVFDSKEKSNEYNVSKSFLKMDVTVELE